MIVESCWSDVLIWVAVSPVVTVTVAWDPAGFSVNCSVVNATKPHVLAVVVGKALGIGSYRITADV